MNPTRCIVSWRGSPRAALWRLLDNLTSTLFVLVPFLVIVTSSVWLGVFLKKAKVLQAQSIRLILAVGGCYMVTFLPYLAYIIVANVLKLPPRVKYRDHLVAHVYVLALYINYLNTFINPVLYYYTSASFKRYIRKWRGYWSSRVGAVSGNNENFQLSSN